MTWNQSEKRVKEEFEHHIYPVRGDIRTVNDR